MAENTAIIRMRLHEWRNHGVISGYKLNLPLTVTAMQPKILHITVEGTPTNAAGFVAIDPCPAVLGVSTAVAIEILSSNDEDNGAVGGAVQSVNIIGIEFQSSL